MRDSAIDARVRRILFRSYCDRVVIPAIIVTIALVFLIVFLICPMLLPGFEIESWPGIILVAVPTGPTFWLVAAALSVLHVRSFARRKGHAKAVRYLIPLMVGRRGRGSRILRRVVSGYT